MATYFTKPNGKTRVQISMKGIREGATFDSKTEARAWATAREAEIIAGVRGDIPDKCFGDLLQRYLDEVVPAKKGARWESVRIRMVLGIDRFGERVKDPDPLAVVPLKDLDGTHVAQWRDRRLNGSHEGDTYIKPVMPASCRREWNLYSSACSVAIGEWKWLKVNPFSKAVGVKRPANSRHRDTVFLPSDIDALTTAAASYSTPTYLRVMRMLRFGIETAMRAGEIVYLGNNPEKVDTTTRVAHLPDTKNGNARHVPLSTEAVRLWNEALADPTEGDAGVWGLTDETRDVHWRDLREKAARVNPVVGRLVFHDSRHTAITHLAKKLQILDLARMTGHSNLNELMTYYNESAASIAQKLG